MFHSKHVMQFEIGAGHNFVYLLLDPDTRQAAIIDPQSDLSEILPILGSYELRSILLTHSHSDHTAGIPRLLERFPRAVVHVHSADRGKLHELAPKHAIQPVSDKQIVPVGNLSVTILHTPGHTSGSCCYRLEQVLFTGDTVFIRSCGRTDLPSGSDEDLFHSFQRLRKLPPETVMLPGHHYTPEFSSTLEQELRTNSAFLCGTLEEFKQIP